MLNIVRGLAVLALLGVPLLVITALPRFFELAASVPAVGGTGASAAAPAQFRLVEATPTVGRASRLAAPRDAPPPTLAPAPTPTAAAFAVPTPSGERVVITNTGGIGAVLRVEPVNGPAVASLREQVVLMVLEHRSVGGGGEWLRVRTPDGKEGWVTALVARPVDAARP